MKISTMANILMLLLVGTGFLGMLTFDADLDNVAASDGNFGGGAGTVYEPYIITDVWDLQAMNSDLSAYYVLAGDIDASATATWNEGKGFLPVGSGVNVFTGRLDGCNHTITGLYINRPNSEFVGLIGNTDTEANVKNMGVIDNKIVGRGLVGALVGNNNGTVSNSYATGTIMGTSYFGGLVGSNWGTVTDSYSTGSTTEIGAWGMAGGLVGMNYGIVTNSYATGTTVGNWSIGGLVGSNLGNVSKSYSTGNIAGTYMVGGLLGSSGGSVSDSYSTGNATGNLEVGGFIGANYRGPVTNSYSTGVATRKAGSLNQDFGGFVGRIYSEGTITNCYSTGKVTYEGTFDPTNKGFSGAVDMGGAYEMTGNFWDKETSRQDNSAGEHPGELEGKITADMKKLDIFIDAGWNFINIWWMLEGLTYPSLKCVSAETVPTAPQNLTATAGNDTIHLTWNIPISDGGTPITGYTIRRGASPGNLTHLVAVGNSLNYTDAGLTNGQTYYYDIAAVNAIGKSPWSNRENATPNTIATISSPPQNLQVAPSDGSAYLTWMMPISDGGSAITRYNIYRGTTSENLSHLITVGNVHYHTDAGLTNGQTYYYRVSALNEVGESPLSHEADATPTEDTSAHADDENGVPGDDADTLEENTIVLFPILMLAVTILVVALLILLKKKKSMA